MNLVEKAIEEIRNETIEHVVNRAQIYVGKVFAQLAEHDWDIERAYPYPASYGLNAVRDRKTYKSMLDQHQFAMYLTKTDYEKHPYSRRMDDPHYRIWDEDQEVKHIKITREAADMSFKAFIHKLTEKIGLDDVVSVELDPINKWL